MHVEEQIVDWLTMVIFILQGGKEYLMRAHFGLPSVIAEDSEGKPPIHVKFEIPYFTVSGIQVCQTVILTIEQTHENQ